MEILRSSWTLLERDSSQRKDQKPHLLHRSLTPPPPAAAPLCAAAVTEELSDAGQLCEIAFLSKSPLSLTSRAQQPTSPPPEEIIQCFPHSLKTGGTGPWTQHLHGDLLQSYPGVIQTSSNSKNTAVPPV